MSPILRGVFSFHSQFFCVGSGLQECPACALSLSPAVVSGLFLVAARSPSNKDADAPGDIRLATAGAIKPLLERSAGRREVRQATHKFRRRPTYGSSEEIVGGLRLGQLAK